MPTRGGNATLDDYKAVLDELSEIIEKYRSTYDIIIGGDMNDILPLRHVLSSFLVGPELYHHQNILYDMRN
jgi:hypothetical protein